MAASTPKEGRARGDLLTVREVAQRLRLSETHVYLMAQHGEIPCVKLSRAVRFDPADVDRFIRDHRRRKSA